MKDLKRIKSILQDHMEELQRTYNVGELGVFGSVAREENKTNDVDILVTFSGRATLITLIKLKHHLSYLLECEVDVVTKEGLKEAIKDDVLQETHYV